MSVAACGGKQAASTEPTPPSGDTAGSAEAGAGAATSAVTAADIVGFYDGHWGQLVLREQDGKLLGAYSHDNGTVSGTLQGDTFTGWWCEVPSRKPHADAGDVVFKFVRGDDGAIKIDGKWRYGAEGDFREDWDIQKSTAAQPDASLTKRFDDPTAFCTKP